MADEYLFGFSGGTPMTLTLDGSTVLSTGTNPLGSGSNQGWWSTNNFNPNGDGNDNYFVGSLGQAQLNNFFTFDISNLINPVSTVTLNLMRYSGWSDLGNLNHTYSLFDVSTDASVLNATNGFSAAIAGDLGSGVSYGSYVISVSGSSGEILNLSLNSAAVADLNAAIAADQRYFSIGGTLTPGGTNSVPEGGSLLTFFGLAFAGLVALRRRK